MDIKQYIRTVPDFPKAGVRFRDITTLLQQPDAFGFTIDRLADRYREWKIDTVVGIDARGFAIASPLAYALNCRLVLARKAGKLPYQTIVQTYELEYAAAAMEMHVDAVNKENQVLVVDDLLATGGTLETACRLVSSLGAEVVECAVIVELPDLAGRVRLEPHAAVHSLVCFEGD